MIANDSKMVCPSKKLQVVFLALAINHLILSQFLFGGITPPPYDGQQMGFWKQICSRAISLVKPKSDRVELSDEIFGEITQFNLDQIANSEHSRAKTYDEIDIYPNPDAVKRNFSWEEILQRSGPLSVIVTLESDLEIKVLNPTSQRIETRLFEQGATIQLNHGHLFHFQEVDEIEINQANPLQQIFK